MKIEKEQRLLNPHQPLRGASIITKLDSKGFSIKMLVYRYPDNEKNQMFETLPQPTEIHRYPTANMNILPITDSFKLKNTKLKIVLQRAKGRGGNGTLKQPAL